MATRWAYLALLASVALTSSCGVGQLVDAPAANVLAVTPAQVAVLASPSSATWSSALAISTAGPNGTSSWTARLVKAAAWVRLTNPSGTAPDTLTVAFSPAGLAPGVYRDTIAIVPTNTSVKPVEVPIELDVSAPPPPPPPPPPSGVATNLAFSTNPPAVLVLNSSFTVAVSAHDAQGHTATSYTGSVKIALQGPISSGGLTGQTRVTAVGGVATFSGLKVSGTCPGCNLVATATGLSSGKSTTFSVVLGP